MDEYAYAASTGPRRPRGERGNTWSRSNAVEMVMGSVQSDDGHAPSGVGASDSPLTLWYEVLVNDTKHSA